MFPSFMWLIFRPSDRPFTFPNVTNCFLFLGCQDITLDLGGQLALPNGAPQSHG